MEAPTLASFIRDSSEQILAEWKEFAKTCSPAADDMTPRELGDHAQQMLDWIADDLETSQTRLEQAEKAKGLADDDLGESPAAKHGAIRFSDNFTLSQVFAEFRALRASVVRLWSRGRSVTENVALQELIRFNEAIDQAVAESVLQFSDGLQESQNIFNAILGHELRNPLGAIMTGANYLQLLSAGAEVDNVAASIQSSSLRMQGLINDLLDVSRKRLGGDLPMTVNRLELHEVCQEVIREINLAHPDLKLNFEYEGSMQGVWDRDRMAQVVSNLIGNAIQHGADGEPIRVSALGKESEVELVVHNWGKVIPPDALLEIFEPTKRLNASIEEVKLTGSLGLGLYIVKLIVEAHGGNIDVTSSEEEGTAFTVHLPRATSLHTPEASLR